MKIEKFSYCCDEKTDNYFYEYYYGTSSLNSEYVKYGADNLTPQKLIWLFENSPAHGSIVKGISDLISGSGVEEKEGTVNFFINQVNPNESLEELIQKVAIDIKLFGGFYLNIIMSKHIPNKIAQIYHLPFQNVRVKVEGGKPSGYWYSWDWNRNRVTNKEFIPIWNPDSPSKSSVLAVQSYSPGMQYYSKPDYDNILNYVQLDYEISNFQLSNIKNSFLPSMWINFNDGIPSDDEKYETRKRLENQFTGSNNAGSLIMTYSPNTESKPDFTTLSVPNLDKMFVEVAKQTLQNIIIGHRVNPEVIGLETSGSLGSADILKKYEVMNKMIIQPYQNKIEKTFTKLFQYNNIDSNIKIKELQPISFNLSENGLLQILTKEEIREILGYTNNTNQNK
jgi:hypothetical protein